MTENILYGIVILLLLIIIQKLFSSNSNDENNNSSITDVEKNNIPITDAGKNNIPITDAGKNNIPITVDVKNNVTNIDCVISSENEYTPCVGISSLFNGGYGERYKNSKIIKYENGNAECVLETVKEKCFIPLKFRLVSYYTGRLFRVDSNFKYSITKSIREPVFELVPSLVGDNVSYSIKDGSNYLRHRQFIIHSHNYDSDPNDTDELFNKDASFFIVPAVNGESGYLSFKSVNLDNTFIMLDSNWLKVEKYNDQIAFRHSMSFKIEV